MSKANMLTNRRFVALSLALCFVALGGCRSRRVTLDATGEKARWSGMAEVKARYATASVISGERIVFNIKGNDYRLVVAADFEKGILWIKWIGRHKDYDRINVRDVKFNG